MFEQPCCGCFEFALIAAGLFAIGNRTDSLALFWFLGLAHSWGHPLWTSVSCFWRISRNKALCGAALDDSITALKKKKKKPTLTNPPAFGSLCWVSIFHRHSKCEEPFPPSRDPNFSSAAANHPPFSLPSSPCNYELSAIITHCTLLCAGQALDAVAQEEYPSSRMEWDHLESSASTPVWRCCWWQGKLQDQFCLYFRAEMKQWRCF